MRPRSGRPTLPSNALDRRARMQFQQRRGDPAGVLVGCQHAEQVAAIA